MTISYARQVFTVAGLFNVVLGAAALLAPATTAGLLGVVRPANPLFMELAAWLVLVFGIGYWLTARTPGRNRDLMLIGGLGKLLVLPLMLGAWRRGDAGLAAVAAGAGDLVFALLFFDVRRRLRPLAPAAYPPLVAGT